VTVSERNRRESLPEEDDVELIFERLERYEGRRRRSRR
jgi:hypothetical protein